ncbi:TPA: hypothetical protein ACH3X2_006256 [Trebouxia sp. C0005]
MGRRRGKTKSTSAPDNGANCGNQGTPQAATGDADGSSDLDDLFAKLSLVEPGDRMASLDAGLAKYCENGKHYKKHIKEKGICLSDCQPYGTGLKQVLKTDANKRVRKKDAKDFPYVKKCLVFLG